MQSLGAICRSNPVLLTAIIALLLSLRVNTLIAADKQTLNSKALEEIQALEEEKGARTPTQQKLDSQFVYALNKRARGFAVKNVPNLQPQAQVRADGRVVVDITAAVSGDLLAHIRSLGGEIINSFPQYRSIRALIPLGTLEELATRPDVTFIERAAQATTNTGSVDGEGDTTHQAASARAALGVTGAGVRIGVLSDSVDHLTESQALHDTGDVAVVADAPGKTGEGTAMLEIIHDLAPGAQLLFATGEPCPSAMAANIAALQALRCKIIVDDVTYPNESPFQDGPIAQAVNAASAAGVLYFSSAGNSGNLLADTSGTWEGDFVDGGAVAPPLTGSGNLHDFGNGMTYNTVTPGGSDRRVDLFWADPLNGSTNDYDLFVLDSTGTSVLRASTGTQTGTQSPYECIDTLNVGERIVIVRRAGAANRFLHLATGRAYLSMPTHGSVRGHNASGATNAFTVAATSALNSFPGSFSGGPANPPETFSSDGPRRIFFKPDGTAITPGNFSSTGGSVLQKPDFTAANRVLCSAAIPSGGLNPFSGTSAAAPHAAAIAALLLSHNPNLTPDQVRAALTSSALDIGPLGFDEVSGSGIIMAPAALLAAQYVCVTNNGTITIVHYTGPGGSVSVPSGINGLPVTGIGSGAFASITDLTALTLPGSITSVGDWAFSDCTGLNSIVVPDGVTSLGIGTFSGCSSLLSATIGDGITILEDYTFSDCPSLTNITIPDGVTSIGDYGFDNCVRLMGVTLPNSLSTIGRYAFDGCSSLSDITIPSSVNNIGDYSFNECTTLTSVSIGNGATNIGSFAFSACTHLDNVSVGRSAISIGAGAFSGCVNLEGAYFQGNAPSVDGSSFGGADEATIYYVIGTTGWAQTLADRPTAVWTTQVQTTVGSVGVVTNQFGFRVVHLPGEPVVIEASVGLNSDWSPLVTNISTDAIFHFSDPDWTNHASRFYRVRSP